ncbi:hypothetical protein G6O69_08075 [Pseudenhygromyxa sp. WMMC2535]|uniref:tetratricopeptide repeat protein n=1 Tax=Pseudenhygromyxa sp. WMMC2535 TaxID=2712867 RepID=UPI0015953E6F|nr:tetratricopeptide repeat protein [Pseudenhygromyxa sp. WMMC2535]NVB37787.1 hypothetical protein [Pseudenhygromyxa sp. WMMC2535]
MVALSTATVSATVAMTACVRVGPDGGRGRRNAAQVPMGSWPAWQDLGPLVEIAESHVDAPTFAALEQAQALLREGKPRAADAALGKASRGAGRHWIAVARADLAALYFERCIRGVAWRLPEDLEGGLARVIDFDPQTRVEPNDLSVEALLTNLDEATAGDEQSALVVQARIARARVASFTLSCPANEEVGRRAGAIMNADLATLAAERHLTPDLAYLWAGVQLQTYSGAAARPFLLQALEGGFDDPALTYMLAAIAFEQGELDEADALAAEAAARYREIGDREQEAQCAYLRGEIARTGERWPLATKHHRRALELQPEHSAAMIGLAAAELGRGETLQATELLHAQIRELMRSDEELDEPAALAVVDALEALVIVANADTLEVAQLTREALLFDIEAEPDPFRRGLRYFYAATLEVRLGDYDAARGHAITASVEFEDTWVNIPPKANPRDFLDRLAAGGG